MIDTAHRSLIAHDYMNHSSLYSHSTDQATWIRIVIRILLDNLPTMDSMPDISRANPTLSKAFYRVCRDENPIHRVIATQALYIDHTPLPPRISVRI